MKTKLFIVTFAVIILSSCVSPQYLPEYKDIDVHPYGSYMAIKFGNGVEANGELISVDKKSLVILILPEMNELIYPTKCVIVPLEEIRSFKLLYAQPTHYGWSIPALGAVAITNGWLGIITLPISIIVTSSVTITGEKAFSFNEENISFAQLSKFARFPQGLPESVDIKKIQ